MNNHEEIEQLIQEKKIEGPRLTQDLVESLIAGIQYVLLPNRRSTLCAITLVNGYTVHGISTMISSVGYDEEIGRVTAYKKAMPEVWEVASVLLTEKLYQDRRQKDNVLRGEKLHFTHYKGGVYKLLNIAKDENTLGEVAVYECVVTGAVYTRPASEFYEKFKCSLDDPDFDYQKHWLQDESNKALERYTKLEKRINKGQPENMTTAQWQLLNRHLLVMREDYDITLCRLQDC